MKDLHNMQFGRLTAVERLPEKKGASYMWLCRCSCGNEVKASTAELLGGRKKKLRVFKSGSLPKADKRYCRAKIRQSDRAAADRETLGRKRCVAMPVRLRQYLRSILQ